MNDTYLFKLTTPIFITNPKPDFLIRPDSQIMILIDATDKRLKRKDTSKSLKKNIVGEEKKIQKEKEIGDKIDKFENLIKAIREKYYELLKANKENIVI